MPGHTSWRTITPQLRKSITKASSSLLDFLSMFPTLGETQAPYVNPAAQPALVARPHRPLPWRCGCPLSPSPAPGEPHQGRRRRRRRPSPLPSFPAGSSARASADTPPPPNPTPYRGRLPSPRTRALWSGFAGGFVTRGTPPAPLPLSPTHTVGPSLRASRSTLGGSVGSIPIPLRHRLSPFRGFCPQSPLARTPPPPAHPGSFTVRLRSPALARTRLPTLRGSLRGSLEPGCSEFSKGGSCEQT